MPRLLAFRVGDTVRVDWPLRFTAAERGKIYRTIEMLSALPGHPDDGSHGQITEQDRPRTAKSESGLASVEPAHSEVPSRHVDELNMANGGTHEHVQKGKQHA